MTSTKPSIALTVDAAVRTHVGLVRQRNEDSAYSGRSLFAVADGLGGHVAGDVASATVIEVLQTRDLQVEPANLPAVLGQAIYEANQALLRKIDTHPALEGMGTTLVALLCSGTSAVVANVGDSRAYLLRGPRELAQLVQITEDHTYENLVSDAASVPNLPAKISRFLDGRADGRSPDLTVRDLRPGDRFLLCSDGLSSVVPLPLIREVLSSRTTPRTAVDRLIMLAIEHGGPDNVTVIVIDVSLG